jgi:putative addiction module component (TIGR02574 family)
MAPTLQSLGIGKVPREQRLYLVQTLWGSIAAESPPPLLNETQRREVKRRADEDDANPANVVPWVKVKTQTLSCPRRSG